MSDDFSVVKIHAMMAFMNMASKFEVMIKQHDSLFVLRNPRLKWSFGLAIVYTDSQLILYTTPDDVWSVSYCCFILLFLEAWMSVKDPNDGNNHMAIPEGYK